MLNRVSQFATKTFLFWMLIAAIIGFVFSEIISALGNISAIPFGYRYVRNGNDN